MSIHGKMNTLNKFKTFLGTFAICLVSGITQPAYSAFDPVNDDTDIFLANPNNIASRPNVLIFLDNTANWNTAFTNEKSALVSVVNSLSDQFNVGFMLFPETGGSNDSVDGAYIRYGIRQMTSTNKSILAADVAGFDVTADKGNNNTLSEGMVEAYRYFAGKANIASHGKIKSDFDGNTSNLAFINGLGDYPLSASPTASTLYNSPISNECQDSFIIYISNGGANENSSSLARAETELAAVGYDISSTISLTPNGQEGSWMDEWAKYLANADINGAANGEPHVYTYVVEIDPVATGQGDDMTALLKSVAMNGKGEYFSVSSGNAGAAIVNALNAIFQEIQAVNSVFAAATLPVSVNVRGTNLNQVYIGVFRPDATKNPRWFGNLKAYKLGFDDVTSTLFLADSQTDVDGDAVSAESSTGFINNTAISHWTSSSSFWGFRNADENGTGGASDSPDGDLVEKGGSAQRLRVEYATSQTARNLYTCTTGGSSSSDDCDTTGDLLSDTPFASSNDDITATSLGLGTTIVENLTGFVTQSGVTINDSQTVTGLTTVATVPITIADGFATKAVNATISSITTGGPQNIGAMTNSPVIKAITAMTRGGGQSKNPVTATVANNNLSVGDPITVSGFNATNDEYNGTFVVTAATTNTFQYNVTASTPDNNPNITNAQISSTSSIVSVTLKGHGFNDNDLVTIVGVTPVDFDGSYNVQNATTNTFTFTTAAPLDPIDTANSIGSVSLPATATGPSSIATVTTAAAHGFFPAVNVTISGATENNYNGTFLIITTPTTTTFTFDHSIIALAAEGAGAKAAQAQSGKTVTASVGAAHTLAVSDTVTITGADSGYNGSHIVTSINTPVLGDFTFEPTDPLPASAVVTATFSAGINTTTATATVPAHGFAAGATVTIAGATPTDYNGEFTIATVPTTDTFTYDVSPATPVPATGVITVRLGASTDDITANVFLTAHGYSAGDVITIAGATPTAYNGEFTILVAPAPTANTFSYTVTGEQTAQGLSTGTITVSVQSTTAIATIPNHGLGDGTAVDPVTLLVTDAANTVTGVTIAGVTSANAGVFNLSNISVVVLTSDTFKYTLASAQGDASGTTILASFGTVSGSAITDLIDWVRGADNEEDENADTSLTDIRSTIHGDVLHSRPAVVNYNRHGANFPLGPDGIAGTADDNTNDEDVYIFYGGNDGIFRAVKGGLGNSATDAGEPIPGLEAWGFIPEEHFTSLTRLRNNSPMISSSFKKPYFMDGSLGTYVKDADGDGILGETGDKVWIFTSNHRGGRFMYAFDVSTPTAPKYLWSKSNNDTGWAELGQTWSVPQVRTLAANSGNPVLIFGAGYDPDVEDLDPATITAVDTTTGAVTSNAVVYNRSMGRGIFVVDAETGAVLVQYGPAAAAHADHTYVTVTDMIYAIPADLAVITDRNGSVDNRAYFGDTGGNLWRLDMADASISNWTVTKIANIADTTTTVADANGDLHLSGLRKFLFPPDVVYGDGQYNNGADFDAILIGSGDREHPFDDTVVNKFYMFKDEGISPLASGDTPVTQNLTESSLFDATSNCIQDTSSCGGVVGSDEEDSVTAAAALGTKSGWFIDLFPGEKVVGNAVTLNDITFFNTNQPTTASSTSCESDLGTARAYQVRYGNATVLEDKNLDGSMTAADRGVIKPGGGYLPSPVPVVVEIDGVIHEGVISGTTVDQPPGADMGARLRKFWYKEIDY